MLSCEKCKKEFEPWAGTDLFGKPLSRFCLDCNENEWAEGEVKHAKEIEQIEAIQAGGHSQHCACRQVWGDGECECDFYKKGYDPYAWMKNNDAAD